MEEHKLKKLCDEINDTKLFGDYKLTINDPNFSDQLYVKSKIMDELAYSIRFDGRLLTYYVYHNNRTIKNYSVFHDHPNYMGLESEKKTLTDLIEKTNKRK